MVQLLFCPNNKKVEVKEVGHASSTEIGVVRSRVTILTNYLHNQLWPLLLIIMGSAHRKILLK